MSLELNLGDSIHIYPPQNKEACALKYMPESNDRER